MNAKHAEVSEDQKAAINKDLDAAKVEEQKEFGETSGPVVTTQENGFVLLSFKNQQLLVRASEINSVSVAETGSPAVKLTIGRKPGVIAVETQEEAKAIFNVLAEFVTGLSGFIGTKEIKGDVSL